jgi:outer membrane protein
MRAKQIYLKLKSLKSPVIYCFIFLLILTTNAYAYKEYTLEELYKIALENSEKIMISEEELYISERMKDKAISVLLPKLSAFGSYTKYSSKEKFSQTGSVIQPQDSALWGIRLDQSFSLSGREITALKISSKRIEKSKYDLFALKEAYLMNVSFAFYDVLKARKMLDIASANVERLTKHRDAALLRLKIGEVTKTTLLRVEAELSGAISEKIRAGNNLNLAKSILARVVGLNEDFEIRESLLTTESFELDFLIPDCKVPAIECLKQLAFTQRVDLKSLEIQKRISEDQVKYTKGAYFPTVLIEGVWTRKDEDPASVFLNKESIYGGIKINFPFFEGGLKRAEVREAEAKKRQAELMYEDARKSINIEVTNAYLDFMTLNGILKSLKDQLAFAMDNFKSVNKQFEFGLANSIDVMDANTLLITSERQLSDAIYSSQVAKIRLKKAVGILLKTIGSRE